MGISQQFWWRYDESLTCPGQVNTTETTSACPAAKNRLIERETKLKNSISKDIRRLSTDVSYPIVICSHDQAPILESGTLTHIPYTPALPHLDGKELLDLILKTCRKRPFIHRQVLKK
ncbi:Uncharacterized protein HZ326_3497 [Fusarium oxysporum f. sp. albedinis]|nr:Uncharacterized protein HZ326_3497 [Fusarium oxysporum f. sp. albedinis]